MTSARYTELEAVNQMLSITSESPVNTLQDSGIPEVALARQLLRETSRMVQAYGWEFNSQEQVTLSLTFPEQFVMVPDDALEVVFDKMSPETRYVIPRGARFYDTQRNSFKFDKPLVASLIVRFFPFDDLPPAAQGYIAIRAGRIFQDRFNGSESLNTFTVADERAALVLMENQEARARDYNALDNWSVGRVLSRQGHGLINPRLSQRQR